MLYYVHSNFSSMQKKSSLVFLCLTLFLFVGAGCKKTPPTVDPESERATREQQAYVYCSGKNFTAQIRFDSEVNRNRLFCIFENGTQCDAIAFMDGKCDAKKATEETDINASLTPPGERFNCEPIAKPVCATDNKTYTNGCIAEALGKTVKYEGVCTEQDEPFIHEQPKNINNTVKKPANDQDTGTSVRRDASWPASSGSPLYGVAKKTPTTPSSGTTVTSKPATTNQAASVEWVGNLTSLLESSASPYPITLSECKEGGNLYYYQKEDCSSCFKILYNNSGESMCYPGMNDDACPVWNEKNCKVIWIK